MKSLNRRDENHDPFGNIKPEKTAKIVGVHESVCGDVHGGEDAPGGGEVFQGVPCVDERRSVMIVVEKEEFLFAQDHERRVE